MTDPAIVQAVVLVILLWVLVDRGPALLRAADLGIGFFLPWRGDPWPRGVQEDDDFRFDWRPARATSGPIPDLLVDAGDPLTSWIEDPDDVGGDVALTRPEHVEVHRAGR